jgi:hypothetical protein
MTEKTTEVSQTTVSSETQGLGDKALPEFNAPIGQQVKQGLNNAADVKTEQVTKETVTPK